MHYKYLSDIGAGYNTEEGLSGHRVPALGALEEALKKAIVDARSAKAPVRAPGLRPLPDGPHYKKKQDKADKLRRWMELEGGVVDADGNIDWSVSSRVVEYDHDLAKRGLTKIFIVGGILKQLNTTGEFTNLDTTDMVTHFSGPGKAIYVMSEEGNLHFSSHSVGYRHHSSLLAGSSVSGAGEMKVINGQLRWLSNKSGHYRPSKQHLVQVLHQLQKKNVSMTFSLQVLPDKKTYSTVGDWLAVWDSEGIPDFELSKLFAYSAHLTPEILGRNNWRWRQDPNVEEAGVYDITTNAAIRHSIVRKWLKSQGLYATTEHQSGAGR